MNSAELKIVETTGEICEKDEKALEEVGDGVLEDMLKQMSRFGVRVSRLLAERRMSRLPEISEEERRELLHWHQGIIVE